MVSRQSQLHSSRFKKRSRHFHVIRPTKSPPLFPFIKNCGQRRWEFNVLVLPAEPFNVVRPLSGSVHAPMDRIPIRFDQNPPDEVEREGPSCDKRLFSFPANSLRDYFTTTLLSTSGTTSHLNLIRARAVRPCHAGFAPP